MIGPGRRPPLPPRWSTWAIVLLLSVEARARPTGWRILVEGPPSAGGFIAAAELELRSFGVELARHRVPGQAQDRETIDRLLGEQRAVGLIRVDRRTRAASVWIC